MENGIEIVTAQIEDQDEEEKKDGHMTTIKEETQIVGDNIETI